MSRLGRARTRATSLLSREHSFEEIEFFRYSGTQYAFKSGQHLSTILPANTRSSRDGSQHVGMIGFDPLEFPYQCVTGLLFEGFDYRFANIRFNAGFQTLA
jgi:hypothetical protein